MSRSARLFGALLAPLLAAALLAAPAVAQVPRDVVVVGMEA